MLNYIKNILSASEISVYKNFCRLGQFGPDLEGMETSERPVAGREDVRDAEGEAGSGKGLSSLESEVMPQRVVRGKGREGGRFCSSCLHRLLSAVTFRGLPYVGRAMGGHNNKGETPPWTDVRQIGLLASRDDRARVSEIGKRWDYAALS